MNTKEQTAQLKAEAIDQLSKLIPRGSTVYTVLRHVSASGMTRRIDLYCINDGCLRFISGYADHVGLAKRHKSKSGLIVGGCGMDMGFHLVYNLADIMYQDGYALKHEWI